jgi:hypothetical protein
MIKEVRYFTATIQIRIAGDDHVISETRRRRYQAVERRMLAIADLFGVEANDHPFVPVIQYKSSNRDLLQTVLDRTLNWMNAQKDVIVV